MKSRRLNAEVFMREHVETYFFRVASKRAAPRLKDGIPRFVKRTFRVVLLGLSMSEVARFCPKLVSICWVRGGGWGAYSGTQSPRQTCP